MTEREREALMRLTMCARNECVMCKYKDSCDSDVRFEFATKHMNILADALRKTEPTISKMEQVEEPVDRDDLGNCNICKYVGLEHRCNQCVNGSMFCKIEDEPHMERSE